MSCRSRRSPAFYDQINYYRTALLELTHATGHASRLDRQLTTGFGTKDYAREELVAEMGSAFLCAALGIVPTVRHADYLASWLAVLREDMTRTRPTVVGGRMAGIGYDGSLVSLFHRLLDLPDPAVMEVLTIVMGETLDSGSVAVEAVGLHLGVDMASTWQADDAFFSLLRDKEVLARIVAEVAGEAVAAANVSEKTKTMKTIVRDHLTGENGREKVANWVPRWMAFPPSAYTPRGGVGTVAAFAKATAAKEVASEGIAGESDQPGPVVPDTAAALADLDEESGEEVPLAFAAE